MRILAALFIVFFGVASGPSQGMAQTSAGAQIQTVIGQQIQAFEADDFAAAFTFASPSIQRLFGGPERFGAMVRNGYPMVWRPSDVTFGELREIEGAMWQKVIVRDQAGVPHVLDYRMVQVDEAWRISAVQLLPSPDVAA
ncbi:MAG: DUF4864 domain-containing protein [Rhodobacteraceae bacterium]|nr:DUF4864 domain-containing protein [Paracoccaceae bacterium]